MELNGIPSPKFSNTVLHKTCKNPQNKNYVNTIILFMVCTQNFLNACQNKDLKHYIQGWNMKSMWKWDSGKSWNMK